MRHNTIQLQDLALFWGVALVQYIDPKQMERIPDDSPPYDPELDWVIIFGQEPHLPGSENARNWGKPCPSCGFRTTEPIVRKRAIVQDGVTIANQRRGLVVCADCCRGSLDGHVEYPGLGIDAAPDEEWMKRYKAEMEEKATEPTKYTADGMQERVLTRREKRAANKKGVKA